MKLLSALALLGFVARECLGSDDMKLPNAIHQMVELDDCDSEKMAKVLAAAGGTDMLNALDDPKSPQSGGTPLHLAAWKGKTACVLTLLELGANLEATNTHGW